MTKTGISEKLRQYSTLLAASLLAFLCLSPSIVSADGVCTLVQLPTGEYTITCEGDGIIINYREHTNEVYVIENCEELKRQLASAVSAIAEDLRSVSSGSISNIRSSINSLHSYTSHLPSEDGSSYLNVLDSMESNLDNIDGGIEDAVSRLDGNPDLGYYDLKSRINDIQCGSCSTNNSGGSCCDVDLTPILDSLNSFYSLSSDIKEILGPFVKLLTRHRYASINVNGDIDLSTSNGYYPLSLADSTIRNLLFNLARTLGEAQPSINNYLYRISQFQLQSISNDVSVLTAASTNFFSQATNYFNVATNFFSFFITNISVGPVLRDWRSVNQDGSYYNFLTSHYIKVSREDFSDMSESQHSKTNWFARIETLIASLVFADSVESTNTVDSSQAESDSDTILSRSLDGIDGIKDASSSQLNVFRGTSQNIVTSLRSISDAFSQISDPGTVVLARVGSNNTSGVGPQVSFETSEIRNLVEACHCVTTLCWCLGGLLLLYYFLHWTVKTSYGLVMFAWGVFSAIFKH